MGREKMKMKKIEDISARQVTFSKRRQGMFKKARELSTLCDAEIAVVVVSPAGRLHNYASSKSLPGAAHCPCNLMASTITSRFLRPWTSHRLNSSYSKRIEDILGKFSMQSDGEKHSTDFQRENKSGVEHLNSGIDEQMKQLRLIMSMYLHKWGIEELQQLEMMLEPILKRVTARKKEIMSKELPAPLQTKK